MRYSFNFGFLRQFVSEYGLQKNDLLECLGIKDYKTLTRWMNGEQPVSMMAALRFCNYYNVNFGVWLLDEDGVSHDLFIEGPGKDDQIIPTGGYPEVRTTGRNILDPRVTERNEKTNEQRRAVEEGLKRRDKQLLESATLARRLMQGGASTTTDVAQDEHDVAILRLRLQHSDEKSNIERHANERTRLAIDDIEKRMEKERKQMLDIIQQQNEEITRLHKLLEGYSRPLRHMHMDDYGMVAEERTKG